MTLDDLAQYTVVEREPIMGTFHNYTMISAPPPSSGGIVLVSALNILEGYDLAKLGDRSAASMHLTTEACRRAYMDRAEYLGDPDYNRIPVAELTAKKYAAAWRRSIVPDNATPSATLTRPAGFLPPAPTTAGQPRRIARHHALFGCGCGGQCGGGDNDAQQRLRLACDCGFAGLSAER